MTIRLLIVVVANVLLSYGLFFGLAVYVQKTMFYASYPIDWGAVILTTLTCGSFTMYTTLLFSSVIFDDWITGAKK